MYDLLKKLNLTEQDIISKVGWEFSESDEFTKSKREIFKRREKLYLWIKDQENKIYVRYVYSTVDTLSALEASDERSVVFSWRKVWMEDYSNNINNVAKFDFEQMQCFRKKYQTRWDKYMYWVGIEVMDYRDKTLSCPTYRVISPTVWCPDWFADVNTWPRYHWFEFKAKRFELDNDTKYYNKDKMMTKEQLDSYQKESSDMVRTQRWLQSSIIYSWDDIIDTYYHYTLINWRSYLVVLCNDKSVLIRFEEIPAMTDIEKKDPSKIWFPVIIRNWRPLRYDPYWVCVPDLLEDKESMMQLFINLSKIKAEHEAFWDMFLFDPDKVDINSVAIPDIWPKYIPVSWLGSQQYPVMSEVPRWTIKQDDYNINNIISQQWSLAIWMDNQTLWISWQANITATENQRVQANSNLRMMLWIKFDNEAEKEFWTWWYKFYLYYFNTSKEKFFKLNDSVGELFYSVKKKDFLWITDIDVEIKSKADLDAKTEKERLGFMAVSQIILNNPWSSQSSKNFAMREMLRLNWVPQEKVNMMIKPTIEELKATNDLQLLNRNKSVWKIKNLNEDHWTYIIIYDRAYDTDAKREAINKRMLAMEMSGQNDVQQQWWETNQWSMQNMIMNDMLQQSNKQQNWAKSLQSITQ